MCKTICLYKKKKLHPPPECHFISKLCVASNDVPMNMAMEGSRSRAGVPFTEAASSPQLLRFHIRSALLHVNPICLMPFPVISLSCSN